MKKILLFVIAIAFISNGFAQKQYKVKEKVNLSKDIVVSGVANNLAAPVLNSKVTNEDVNRIYAGKAQNVRSVRREDNKAISYNPDLDIISMTFLLDPATYGTNSTDIGMVYSTDKGQTWSDIVIINEEGGNSYINDYPSGIVYNPAGNTNHLDAFGLIQNISHQGAWSSQYKMWSSKTLGGENQDIVIINESNHEADYWNQYGLVQVEEDVRCLSMWPEGEWGAYTSASLQPIFGEFEDNTFGWDDSEFVDMDLYLYEGGDLDGTICWIGRFQGYDGGIEMAWSDNGEIGYIWMIGSTADDPSGMQPIIHKTTDSGNSWDMIDLGFFEDEGQALFEPYLPPSFGGLIIPRVSESAGIVDYHGDLQLVIMADAYATDVYNHPDSLSGELYVYASPGDVYNLEINDNGIQNVIYIDSLFTDVIIDDNGDFSYNGVGWTHRLSIAKNDFENEFFVTWVDSRIEEEDAVNYQPDIFGWSRNIHNGGQTESVCFTEGTLYEMFYFFTYGADDAYYDAENDTYTVPYMQTISPSEFASNGAGDPISVNYITGIEFPALGDYVGVGELNAVSGFSVTQNTPNPFNGTTTINVSTETSSAVIIEVSNIMGQTIYTLNSTVNGTKEIILSSNHMEAGVYFYTVTIGSETITKKMVVK